MSRLLLLLSLCAALCCGRYDHEDWTDPTDMFNYDAATGRMIRQQHKTEENVEGVCEKEGEESCPGGRAALETTTQKSLEPKHQEVTIIRERSSNPVFRRFLRKILNEAERFGLPEDSSSEVYYNAELVLTKQMMMEIQKFLDDEDWNMGALEEAMIRMLVQFRSHSVKEWWAAMFEDYIGIDIGTTFKILLCITCIVSVIATELWSRIGWFTQVKRLCILCFFVSVGWNWMYLYKVAFAERQAELAKLQKFDGSCGEKISWSESLLEWWRGAATFQNDPCEEYFKSLMINPVLMVPPTKALALTFTDFITEPLKHIGKAMGEFLNGLLAEIPVFYQLLVLILIAAIIMVSCYGASTTVGQVLAHRNNREPHQERLPPAGPPEERLPPPWERLPPAGPPQERLPPAGPPQERLPPAGPPQERLPPPLERLPPAGPPQERLPPPRERLPPAGLPRQHYGNVIEGWHQPPYYIEPGYVPVYRYPRIQRPENLKAMDPPYDGSDTYLPGLTDVDFPVRDEGQEWKKEEVTEHKPIKEARGETAEPTGESPAKRPQRKEELKERSGSPRKLETETSFSEMPRKVRAPERKSSDYPDPIQEVTDGTEQSKTETVHRRSHSQEREEQNGGHEGIHNPVEEISHGEQPWREGEPEDTVLGETGSSDGDHPEQKTDGEEDNSPRV